MARIWHVAGVAVLLLLITSPIARADEVEDEDSDEYGETEEERAYLVVRKTVNQELAVQGRNVTVTVDIFNWGASSAADVKLEDTLPESATLVEGSLTKTFERIASGSRVNTSYVIVYNQGILGAKLPLATVTYRPDSESNEKQTGLSSTAELHVMTPTQQITRYALMTGRWVSLGIAKTPEDWRNAAIFIVLVGGLLGGNYGYKAYNSDQVSRKRVRALRELEN